MSVSLSPLCVSLHPAEMVAALRERLLRPLPGPPTQRRMAPELAYGRHSGPPALDAREAAVLVLLYPDRGTWFVPAMLRPSEMKFHAGQVALPGGVVEPGEAPYETALRELQEELGVGSDGLAVMGALWPLYVFNSNFWIKPLLAVAAQRPEFQLSPREAAELVEIPVATLVDPGPPGAHLVQRRGLVFSAPHYQVGPHRVWGATSMILAELAAILRGE